MEPIVFLVQGSSAEPYQVTFTKRSEGNLTAHCTCPAGRMSMYCKHRINILLGDVTDIVSKNEETVHTVYDWYRDSDVEREVKNIDRLEREIDDLKKTLSAAKKRVSAAMMD